MNVELSTIELFMVRSALASKSDILFNMAIESRKLGYLNESAKRDGLAKGYMLLRDKFTEPRS